MRSHVLHAAVVFVIACRTPEPATFRYASCCLGCETSRPMMVGDEENIVVTGSVPDSVSVESSAPSVISVKAAWRTCCPAGADAASTLCRDVALSDACESKETTTLIVTVNALAEGSGDLRAEKSDGSVWGAVTLSVEKAVSIGLACNAKGSVTLTQGGHCPVTVRPTDANGTALMSTGGTIYVESSDPSIVDFNALFELNVGGTVVSGCLPDGLGVDMTAKTPGDATVTAFVLGGGATEALAVHVIP